MWRAAARGLHFGGVGAVCKVKREGGEGGGGGGVIAGSSCCSVGAALEQCGGGVGAA